MQPQKMKIKKKHNNKYLLSKTGVCWIRDFTAKHVAKIDINRTSSPDATLFLRNEIDNYRQMNGTLEESRIVHSNIVIVSDGYDWEEKQEILAELPYKEVAIIGTNKSLAKWKMVGDQAKVKRAMSFYVVNNPFPECMRFLPSKHSYFPNCIASTRTYPKFAQEYKGQTFFYSPSNDTYFSSQVNLDFTIDDYRNPMCAAIQMAYLFGVQKLLLFCCDDSFDKNKPGSVRLENGLWTYPQQLISQHIIDANLYWLKANGVRVGDCSMGIKYDSADYIEPEHIPRFFREEDEQTLNF
jgi:hypothetical protein